MISCAAWSGITKQRICWVISDEDHKNDWSLLKTQNLLRFWLIEQLWRTYVLKKQARKARAEHLVKCSLALGKRQVRRGPLSELYVNGNFTEDRQEWHRELQKQCEMVHTDQEQTREARVKSIEYFKKEGDWHFTEDGRGAEITIDLVLQARAKMSENKVNGPEDATVSEMIKQLPLENVYTVTRCFQQRFMGQMESPSSWKIVKLVFLRKPDAAPKKGIGSCRAIAMTLVMSKYYASCHCSSSGKGKSFWELKETACCAHIPCRTHIFLTFPRVAYRHRAHAWLKVFAVRMSYLSISPSPLTCFIRRLCCSRTVTSTPRSRLHLPCRTVPDPKARVKRTSARAARSSATLADSTHFAGNGPKEFDKITSADGDTTSINDPNYDNISDFSKITRENTGLFGVSTMLEASVSNVSHGESKDNMPRETEREMKEKVLWSVLQSRCQGEVDGTVSGVILLRLTKNSILMNEISENTLDEELNRLFLVKLQFRETIFDWVRPRDPKFGMKKFRTCVDWVATRASISKTTIAGSKSMGRSSSAWENYTCAVNWRWRTVFKRNATQEVVKKLKHWEDAAKKKNKLNIICSRIWNLKQWVYHGIKFRTYKSDWNLLKIQNLPRSWVTEQLWHTFVHHQALITSSSRKPSREVGMPRNTRENMSILGNVFWLSTCSTRSWWIFQ